MTQQKSNLTSEELLWKIYENTEKARKYILWGRIMTVIYLILILAPIILAVIYLPPLIEKAAEPYKELLDTGSQSQNLLENLQKGGIDIEGLMKKYK